MAVRRSIKNVDYGFNNALQVISPLPIIANRAPTTADTAELGTLWVDKPDNAWYILTSIVAGAANWQGQSSGSGTFTDLTVTNTSHLEGPVTMDSTLSVAGATTLSGNVTLTGNLTMTGNLNVTAVGAIHLVSDNNSATAIFLQASNVVGGISVDSGTGGIGLTTTGGIGLTTTNGPITLASGTGAITIGNDAAAHTITIGNTTGATAVAVRVGTGNYSLDGVASSTYAMGASTTTGTITIGGTAQTGTITLGSSSGSNTIDIGAGAGGTTVTIAKGTAGNLVQIGGGINTGAQLVEIANGASAGDSTVRILSNGSASAGNSTLAMANSPRVNTIQLANVASAAARTTLICGGNATQNDSLTIMNGAPSAGSQTISLLSGAASGGTQTVNICNGAAGAATTQNVNIMNGVFAGLSTVNIMGDAATSPGTINIGTGGAHDVQLGGTTSVTSIVGASIAISPASATGNITIDSATVTSTAAAVSVTLNAYLMQAVFTGSTTASGATLTVTINNNKITTSSRILGLSVISQGSNDAQMTVQGAKQGAGTLVLVLKNNGAAALNGDVHVCFWVMA